jgi:hypothetical protein
VLSETHRVPEEKGEKSEGTKSSTETTLGLLMGFKPIIISGVTCPKCASDKAIHPHGSKHGKKYFKCYICNFIFVTEEERERPVRNLAEKMSHAESNHLWYIKNRDRIIKQKMLGYIPHPRKPKPKRERFALSAKENVKCNDNRDYEGLKPLPLPLAVKKPLSSIESIQDTPCFRRCINTFAPCDPTTCPLLSEWLGLYQFPLMVVVQ